MTPALTFASENLGKKFWKFLNAVDSLALRNCSIKPGVEALESSQYLPWMSLEKFFYPNLGQEQSTRNDSGTVFVLFVQRKEPSH
ncbi:hypothetical protein TNIN_118251 [Trichonephila inaurata madagascariensis]|uniref:Uncharacterized protein n=1 Tax=Trichonephila inaurata madagascariensis TaxID=2747483 RepID=A0A8X7CI76_9ARAC|nr:hypothetical protein TNIN_118251 [Trichonephila inaurata madagascariensis]